MITAIAYAGVAAGTVAAGAAAAGITAYWRAVQAGRADTTREQGQETGQ